MEEKGGGKEGEMRGKEGGGKDKELIIHGGWLQ